MSHLARWLRTRGPVVAAIGASFLLVSAVRAPVPGPNEPHYLTKARHFWQPDYCAGDLFLESADAHPVFYWSVGWLTTVCSLEQTAWIARVVGFLLLAVGFAAMCWRILPGRWSPVWCCWMLLFLQSVGNLSGEWLIGGIEAKVFSFAAVFGAIAYLLDGRWTPAAVLAGVAIGFHPLVGGWSVIAAAIAGFCRFLLLPLGSLNRHDASHVFQRAALPLTIMIVLATPGLAPALQLLTDAPSPRTSFDADYLQVYYRLSHHLDPYRFQSLAWLSYAGLLAFWLIGRLFAERNPAERWFAWFVLATVLIGAAGLVAGALPRIDDGSEHGAPDHTVPLFALRMRLLKFYPFRMCDLLIPVAAAIAATLLAERFIRSAAIGTWRRRIVWGATAALLAAAVLLPADDARPDMSDVRFANYRLACRWIAENTPPQAVFLPARDNWAFKWLTGRPEYVSIKDCPQDAESIVEWNRRLQVFGAWAQRHFKSGYSAAALRELHEQTGIDYIFVRGDGGPFAIKPIYCTPGNPEESYCVYRLVDDGRARLLPSRGRGDSNGISLVLGSPGSSRWARE